jgi:hypothetical protein
MGHISKKRFLTNAFVGDMASDELLSIREIFKIRRPKLLPVNESLVNRHTNGKALNAACIYTGMGRRLKYNMIKPTMPIIR